MVSSGVMIVMHRSGEFAKSLVSDTERTIRDLVKGCKGSEIAFERAGSSFMLEMDVKAGEEGWSIQNTRPTREGT